MASAAEIRRQALQDQELGNDAQDVIDTRSAAIESSQEMHERMLAEDSAEETLDVLEGLRALQSGELVTWHVYRIAGPNGEPLPSGPSQFLCVMGNAQLTQENIAKQYGGGKYKVRGRYSDGKFAGQRTIDIGPDAKREEVHSMAAASNSFNMSEFLALQQHQDQVREERFEKRMMTLAGICAPIITAFVGRPAGAAPDLAALITALRPVTTPPDPAVGMKSMVETMLLMRKLNGDSDGDSIGSIIAAVAPHAGPVLTALATRPPAAPVRQRIVRPVPGSQPSQSAKPQIQQAPPLATQAQPVVVQPTHHTGVNLDAPTQPMTDETRHMFAQLKPQVDTLVTMARDGADPIETANVFFEQVMINPATDEAIYSRLCDLFENPNAITQIAIFNTGVKEQHVFFEAFQKRVMERIQAEDQSVQGTPQT